MKSYKLTIEVEVFADGPAAGFLRAGRRATELVGQMKRIPVRGLDQLPAGGITGGPGRLFPEGEVRLTEMSQEQMSDTFWKARFHFEEDKG